jgi:hypothetical protein
MLGRLKTPAFGHLAEAFLASNGGMLPPARIRDMLSPHASSHAVPTQSYGYGLFTQKLGDDRLIWHSGDLPGYHSMLSMIPEQGFAVVVMTNGDQLTGASAIERITNDAIIQFALPPNIQPYALETDASTWGIYAGTYVDDAGALGTVSVHLDGSVLSFEAPALDAGGVLTQAATDLFVTASGIPVTFWSDDGGAASYLVTRIGVGARQP